MVRICFCWASSLQEMKVDGILGKDSSAAMVKRGKVEQRDRIIQEKTYFPYIIHEDSTSEEWTGSDCSRKNPISLYNQTMYFVLMSPSSLICKIKGSLLLSEWYKDVWTPATKEELCYAFCWSTSPVHLISWQPEKSSVSLTFLMYTVKGLS